MSGHRPIRWKGRRRDANEANPNVNHNEPVGGYWVLGFSFSPLTEFRNRRPKRVLPRFDCVSILPSFTEFFFCFLFFFLVPLGETQKNSVKPEKFHRNSFFFPTKLDQDIAPGVAPGVALGNHLNPIKTSLRPEPTRWKPIDRRVGGRRR